MSRVADLQMFRDLLKTLQSLEHATDRLKGRHVVSPRSNEHELFFKTVGALASEASELYKQKIAEWQTDLRHTTNPEQLKALCGKMDLLRAFVSLAYLCFNKVCKLHDSRTQTALSGKCMEQIFAEKFYSSMQLADLIVAVKCRLAELCGIRREDFTCGLCTDVAERPCVLTCGHAFCLHCLRDADIEKDNRKCPACRKINAFDGTFRVHKELYSFITARVNAVLDDDPTPRKRRRVRNRTKRGKNMRKKKVLACFMLGATLPQGFSPSSVYRSIHEKNQHSNSDPSSDTEWGPASSTSSPSDDRERERERDHTLSPRFRPSTASSASSSAGAEPQPLF